MKRILAVLILVVHLISVTGVSAHVHYCGDTLTGVSLSVPGAEDDCNCNVVKKTDCCSDLRVSSRMEHEALAGSSFKLSHSQAQVSVHAACAPAFMLNNYFSCALRAAIRPTASDDPVDLALHVIRLTILRT